MTPKCCVVILVLINICHLVNSQCSVNIRNNIPDKDPVYLKLSGSTYDLWAPAGASLTWTAGASHLLTCSGSSNYLTVNSQTSSVATCVSGTTFSVGGTSYSSASLACSSTITGDIKNTGTSCGNNAGTLLNIGFDTGSNGFVTYIQACYNMATGSAIYTRHIIPGRAINYSVIESARPSFKTTGTASHVSPATSYTQASQMTRFTTLLGSQAQAEKYLTSSSFLSRGHLSPDGDGIFRSWQFATYFYTNVAPEWQVVNAGNWLRVENAARDKSASLQEDVIIFTGAHGVLTLPHVNGNQIPITLEAGGNIEVPKWFWKVIKSTATNAAIALVTLNNPFATSLPSNEFLCSDICSSYGWANSYYSDFSKGYTYCCTVASLRSSIPAIPSEATASSVLRF